MEEIKYLWRRFVRWYRTTLDTRELFNCPEMPVWSPFSRQPQYWRKQGVDKRECSGCGSMHPEDFFKHIDDVINSKDKDVTIQLNDRGNKIYIQRIGVKNAGDGSIKIYISHIIKWCQDQKMNKVEIKGYDDLIHKARIVSADKHAERYNIFKT